MFFESINYVVSANMFWQSIMMTWFIGFILGITVHNGDVKGATKTMIVLTPLAMLVAMTSFFRVSPHIENDIITIKTYASTITAIFVASAYIFGFIIGTFVLRKSHIQHLKG